MIANGSVKWNVRTVLTSSSSQNWMSMISGAGPEQHGVISNDWEMDDHSLPPIVQEVDGRFQRYLVCFTEKNRKQKSERYITGMVLAGCFRKTL